MAQAKVEVSQKVELNPNPRDLAILERMTQMGTNDPNEARLSLMEEEREDDRRTYKPGS